MSQLNVDTIKKADGTGNLSVPAETGTLVIKDGSNDVTLNDLTLSGGVYLGGTTSANFLDDYEEGNWTPAFQSAAGTSLTVSSADGKYTKIGRFVMLSLRMNVTSSGSGIGSDATIINLPFTPGAALVPTTSFDYTGHSGTLSNSSAFSAEDQFSYFIDAGVSRIVLATANKGAVNGIPTSAFSGDESMRLHVQYFTDS